MARLSAGILLHRRRDGETEVLLGHMGGPFWSRKESGAWSLPKGEYGPDEQPEAAARREFHEELGIPLPAGDLVPLGSVRQSGGKEVIAWTLESDLDLSGFDPGTFTMEWPKGSGRIRAFPEVDRVEWVTLPVARERMVKAQRAFLDRLVELVGPAHQD